MCEKEVGGREIGIVKVDKLFSFLCSQSELAELKFHSLAEQKPPFKNPRSTTGDVDYVD